MKSVTLTLAALVIASVSACRTTPVAAPSALQAQSNISQQNISSQGVVDSRFEYKNGKTELNLIIERSNGEEVTLHSIRSPGSSSVTVQTTIRDSSGQVTSRYNTSPSEAQLGVKLSANNGWRDVYNDLKSRYELAGLI